MSGWAEWRKPPSKEFKVTVLVVVVAMLCLAMLCPVVPTATWAGRKSAIVSAIRAYRRETGKWPMSEAELPDLARLKARVEVRFRFRLLLVRRREERATYALELGPGHHLLRLTPPQY